MIQKFVLFSVALGLIAGLSGCTGQDVKRSLGVKRNQPDAFQVVSRPPLSLPPVYHLRPPADGPEQGVGADEQAKALLLDGKELERRREPNNSYYHTKTAAVGVESTELGTAADDEFLRNAGADQAKPDIRRLLQEETRTYEQQVTAQKSGLLEKLNPFERKNGDPVVNAQAEAERIRQAKESGEPLDKGEVPEIDPKKESVL